VDLETWLRQKNMTTISFAKKVGCSRPVINKVKNGIPICPKYANKIIELTESAVKPSTENIGRKPL